MLTEYAAMPGLDGRKMSKSYDNAIHISDSPEETIAKVRTMFTDPTKIHKTDPGHPAGCAVFGMQSAYGRADMHDDCEAGHIGCVECKMRLATFLNDRLAAIRARRADLLAHPEQLDAILASGAEKARKVARETMAEVRTVMNLG